MIFDLSVTSGLAHCHARGLYSIVLQAAPMVRLFYAAPDHALYRNQTGRVVGFHAHHCNLTLIPVFGQITNVFGQRQNLRPTAKDYTERKVVDTRAFWYQSVITGGVRSGAGFRAISPTIHTIRVWPRPMHDAMIMDAGALHTIDLVRGQDAAWVVFEGGEDPFYRPVTYAPLCVDLTRTSFDGMYQPMPEDEIRKVLARVTAMGLYGQVSFEQTESGSRDETERLMNKILIANSQPRGESMIQALRKLEKDRP